VDDITSGVGNTNIYQCHPLAGDIDGSVQLKERKEKGRGVNNNNFYQCYPLAGDINGGVCN
jgi:hypothetical protein